MAIILDYPDTGITALTLLGLIQKFCRRTGLAVPTAVVASTDTQARQILALLEEEGNSLSQRGDWQQLTFEATHTTLATESQGTITSIMGNNFSYIKPDTFWDRTENLPIMIIDGPDWQAEKGFSSTSPRYRVRIRNNELYSTPTPPAGNTWAFEYVSQNWITDGVDKKKYFEDDSEVILLPDDVILMGLRWRWKKEKGMEYEEDFNTYERMVANALGREGIKRTLKMDRTTKEHVPGIIVPEGNWVL